jgi:hypothetical protein
VKGIGFTLRARLGDQADLVAERTQAAHQPVDDAFDAAIEPGRHLDLGIGGDQDAHQRRASMNSE